MPVCKKCSKDFPIKVIIDDKQRNLSGRKYCLECSPFGLHNTSKLEKNARPNGKKCKRKKKCSQCQEIRYTTVRNSICSTCRSKNKRHKHKTKAREILGGKCSLCGYKRCQNALDFHHNDKNNKSFTLSSNWHISWKRIESEIKKCVLLCRCCHVEVHEKMALMT